MKNPFRVTKKDGETVIKFGHETSDVVSPDNDYVTWTFNIAPEEINTPADLSKQAGYLNRIAEFMRALNGWVKKVEVANDFYWKDGDLLVEISVSVKEKWIENLGYFK